MLPQGDVPLNGGTCRARRPSGRHDYLGDDRGDASALFAQPEVAERVGKWSGVLDKGAAGS